MIAMMEVKVPPLVIAAILKEQAGTKVQPEFDELDCSECELSACIVQGGVHSTFCWNALVGYLIQILLPVWLDKILDGRARQTSLDHWWLTLVTPM